MKSAITVVAGQAAPWQRSSLAPRGRATKIVAGASRLRSAPSPFPSRLRSHPVPPRSRSEGGHASMMVRAMAATTANASASAPAPPASPGFLKQLLIAVVKFIITLLPGRLGLTWLAGLLPKKVKTTFLDLFNMYNSEMEKAVQDKKKANAATMTVFKDMCKTYAEQLIAPYKFPSYHRMMRKPTDYFKMGQQYIGCLLDFDRSILMHPERWAQIKRWIDAKENVILLANHQSEGDAAFIPLMTELSHPGLGEQVTYVAGDRVVSDKLAKPFSMGRNLLCVHSKKHMMGDPATRSQKMRENVRTLKEMERLLKQGGMLIWIAPSGGRDRRSPDGTITPAEFDSAAVEMMVRLGTKTTVQKTHFVPMAMSTYDIMPPPETTEKALGEKRVVHFTGAGLSVGEEIDVSPEGPWAQGVDTSDKAASGKALAGHVYSKVCDLYTPIAACNIPGGGPQPLPADSIRPVKPSIVPR